jgi:hypothetical protein
MRSFSVSAPITADASGNATTEDSGRVGGDAEDHADGETGAEPRDISRIEDDRRGKELAGKLEHVVTSPALQVEPGSRESHEARHDDRSHLVVVPAERQKRRVGQGKRGPRA